MKLIFRLLSLPSSLKEVGLDVSPSPKTLENFEKGLDIVILDCLQLFSYSLQTSISMCELFLHVIWHAKATAFVLTCGSKNKTFHASIFCAKEEI